MDNEIIEIKEDNIYKLLEAKSIDINFMYSKIDKSLKELFSTFTNDNTYYYSRIGTLEETEKFNNSIKELQKVLKKINDSSKVYIDLLEVEYLK